MGRRPLLAGTRIPPDTIVRLLEVGWSEERISAEYPEITAADIDAARAHDRAGRAG